MIKHDGDTVWNGSPWMMNVTDETGASVFTIRFSADDTRACLFRLSTCRNSQGVHERAQAIVTVNSRTKAPRLIVAHRLTNVWNAYATAA
jgi:hypothetical protein